MSVKIRMQIKTLTWLLRFYFLLKAVDLPVTVEQENDKNENSRDKHDVICRHDISFGFTPSLKMAR